MNLRSLPRYVCLVAAFFCNVSPLAQSPVPDVLKVQASVAADVEQAAAQAKVYADPLLIGGFVNATHDQGPAVRRVYDDLARPVRIERLARYLTAKESANATVPPSSRRPDLVDFQWGYLSQDVSYTPLRLDAPKDARLLRIELAGGQYAFSNYVVKNKAEAPLLLPATYMTATFQLGEQIALWSGNPAFGPLKIFPATTAQGCEIYVNSTPQQSVIYFNGKKFYATTKTSMVGDPGTWDVTLRHDGYKDWKEQRSLGPGESWTIEASLIKQ